MRRLLVVLYSSTLHKAKAVRMDAILGAHDLGGLLLLKDSLESPGAFVMLHILKLALSLSYRVALVSVAQGAQHYQPLLRKLGINLQAATSSGQLVFLDALHSVAGLAGGQAAPRISLQGLFYQVAELAASNSSSQPLCLVVDDLSLLAAFASDPHQLPAFLHHCCQLCGDSAAPKGAGCFVALTHWDVGADEPWLSRLEHAAQTVVEVEPLASGQAADVTGNLTVCRRRLPSARPASAGGDAFAAAGAHQAILLGHTGLGSQSYYYRLSENSAAYFPQAG